MTKLKLSDKRPGLLVSVRNGDEALAALAGGADLIDVKEPTRGSLGAADQDAISIVVRAVNRRSLVSAACGELIDLIGSPNGARTWPLPSGISLFKIGLAACAALRNWQTHWRHAIEAIGYPQLKIKAHPVAVVYADWRDARSPGPQDVLEAAVQNRCPALLIDTFDKSAGSLFDHWPIDDLRRFLVAVRERRLAVVLAGSLTGDRIAMAAQLVPDLIAVRTAACESGRAGTVSEKRVREVKRAIDAASRTAVLI